ncbi:MAG TPA: hypothetical protein VIL48_17085 [Acidimicrobiales bacterium]
MSEISRACGGGDTGRSLVPGTLRGYRTWRPAGRRVRIPEGALPLTSVTRRRVVWPPMLVARCAPSPVGRRGLAGPPLGFPGQPPGPPNPPPAGPPAGPPDPRAGSPGSPGSEAQEGPAPDHRAPQLGCDCGIYAWYAPDDTRILHARVFGVVEASGVVLMGERGFRAEKVRIRAVATRHRRVAAACAAAGIPVYRRRRDLIRDHPPEDLSALLGPPEAEQENDGPDEPDPDPSTGVNRVDRTLVLAVWARTAFLAVAVGVLPVAAAVLCVAVAELALVGLIVTRFR